VRAGSRSGNPPFDWDSKDTWKPAIKGASAAYLTYQPDLMVPGAAAAIGEFAELAASLGVNRLVLLSGRGEEGARRSEEALIQSGVDYTILRCSWFCQNFSENFLVEGILAGQIALPAGNVPEPFIDVDDIADVAEAALTDDKHIGQIYEMTGPRLLTFTEAVAEIAKATGRDIQFIDISASDFIQSMKDQSVPPDIAVLLSELFTEVLDGRNAYLADGVERALGRKPRDFSDYVQAAAATGIWGTE
jgi:uncharacterized protein YbjT (DUF2867 family)